MAKKTNKTDHVLNLLAGSPEMEEEPAKGTKAGKRELTGANVQVIDSQEDEDFIANEVNRLLEEELEESDALEIEDEKAAMEEGPVTEEMAETVMEAPAPTAEDLGEDLEAAVEPSASEDAAPSVSATPEAAEMPAAVEEAKVEDVVMAEPEAAASAGEPMAVAAVEEPKAVVVKSADKPVVVAESELELDGEEDADYVFVNVMGKLVKERVGEYMEEFGNCTCSRCIADTTALALIHLPPKYVVVSKNAETPLLNFYRQHYAAQITVEITKACTKVKQHPHHNRD